VITIKRDFYAYLDKMQIITILLPFSYNKGQSNEFYFMEGDLKQSLTIKEKINLKDAIKYICYTPLILQFGQTYWITDEHKGKTDLQMGAVIRTPEFDQLFYYDGNDLGVSYQTNKTQFKLWAPTATAVRLTLTSKNGSKDICDMTRQERGIWSYEEQGDLEGFHYTYLVCVNLRWCEAVDPYAVAVTANGKEGVIIDLEKTRSPKPALPPFEHAVDAIIYESHVRDLTIHPESGASFKGKYLGAAELGTFSPAAGITGLSYIKDLGITHIEFLPLNDFEGVNELGDYCDYNWGYNPLHFNAPEGSYSTNPNEPYTRINELKRLIRTIHEQGIRVILDVVYNHVFDKENSSFEKLVPGYYFRHDEFGMPSNGTGVGNDMASERLMVRKFILDSVHFWIQEYQIDGLRFDLMGILDIDTMNAVRELTDQLDPTFLLIGEGWELNTPLPLEKKATLRNQQMLPRIGQFNDQFRDGIKGSTFALSDKGYVLGNVEKVPIAKHVISGSISLAEGKIGLFNEPGQTVNYLESHDNHTMWDKFSKILHPNQDCMRKFHRLATTILLLSQGIPFLHSGQEFYRTKNGNGNSYNAPNSINQLDWVRKQTFKNDVDYIKGIIELRKSHQAFRFRTSAQIRSHFEWMEIPEPLLSYRLKDIKAYGGWSELLVIFNPTTSVQTIQIPVCMGWKMLVNHERAGSQPVMEIKNQQLRVEPISALVLGKDSH
jgi:pullulanase